MTYGAGSNLTSMTDAAGNTTQYGYGPTGNLLSITYPDGTQQSFTYDPLGNLSETVVAKRRRDKLPVQLPGADHPRGLRRWHHRTFTYDGHGNLLTAKTFNASGTLTGTTTLTYNAANQLLSIVYPNGQFLDLHLQRRRASGPRASIRAGFTVNYSYDALGRLSELTDGSGNLIVQYTYNSLGPIARKVNGNGTSTTYAYDADRKPDQRGELRQGRAATTVNSSFTYTYNALDEQTSMTDAAGNAPPMPTTPSAS